MSAPGRFVSGLRIGYISPNGLGSDSKWLSPQRDARPPSFVEKESLVLALLDQLLVAVQPQASNISNTPF